MSIYNGNSFASLCSLDYRPAYYLWLNSSVCILFYKMLIPVIGKLSAGTVIGKAQSAN